MSRVISKAELREHVVNISMSGHEGDLVDAELVLDLIDQLDEPKIISQTQAVEFLAGEYNLTEDEVDKVLLNYRKPVVPSFVAEWFEDNKHNLEYAIYSKHYDIIKCGKVSQFEHWLVQAKNASIETLIRMKNGYTLKEKKYCIKMGNVYYRRAFEFTAWKNKALVFADKMHAEAEARQLGGIVEEVTNE